MEDESCCGEIQQRGAVIWYCCDENRESETLLTPRCMAVMLWWSPLVFSAGVLIDEWADFCREVPWREGRGDFHCPFRVPSVLG